MYINDIGEQSLSDQLNKNLPEYSDYMYLQGYTPTEIYQSFRKTFYKQIAEQEAANSEDQDTSYNIKGEVLLNGRRL